MAGGARVPGASVTSRVLAVLWAFDAEHPRPTLSEVARRADLPVQTAARLLGELVVGELLVRTDDGRYQVGRRAWQLGLLAPVNRELREIALPFMHDLHTATGDIVHLAVREDTTALYLERMVGRGSVPVVSRMGARLPLHATGVGKVLLCEAPLPVRHAVLGSLTRITPFTLAEPGPLARELATVRQRGYARTSEEMTLGACSLAVPVRDHSGSIVAALGIVTSTARSRSMTTRVLPALQVAAAAIGRGLEPASR